jgi:hypothetical protein
VGWVDDLGVELSQARLGIVAEPAGGGFKLKSLDYVFNRLPMTALVGSVAGLPLAADDLILCKDEASLAAASVAILDDLDRLNRMQNSAYTACQPLRGWVKQGQQFLDALSPVRQH